MSRAYPGIVETMELETGDTADYRTMTEGIELEVLDADEKRLAMLFFRWDEVAPLLRGMYAASWTVLDRTSPNRLLNPLPLLKNLPKLPSPLRDPPLRPRRSTPSRWRSIPATRIICPMTWWWNGCTLTGRNPLRLRRRRKLSYHGRPPGGRRPKRKVLAQHQGHCHAETDRAGKPPRYPEEQHLLSQYVGWGGLPDAFDPEKPAWAAEYSELKELLTPEEYAAARASTLNAHYTSPTVIKAIYEAVAAWAFRPGIFWSRPAAWATSLGCCRRVWPEASCTAWSWIPSAGGLPSSSIPRRTSPWRGFETTDRRDFYDLAVGNVPFGQYQVNDKAYNKLHFNIHNYFFAKALDQVRPGGVVAFVTSRYTMDAKDSTVRRYLAQRAELLGAIRLPNDAFKKNAGTEVVSDIIFLQKRDRPLDIAPDWTRPARSKMVLPSTSISWTTRRWCWAVRNRKAPLTAWTTP